MVALAPRQAAQSPGAAPTRPAITLTAAQRTLYRLSSVAANAPQGQGLGRDAVEISWLDRVTSVTLATFEDPSTTRMLETTDTAAPAAVNGHTGSTGRDLYCPPPGPGPCRPTLTADHPLSPR